MYILQRYRLSHIVEAPHINKRFLNEFQLHRTELACFLASEVVVKVTKTTSLTLDMGPPHLVRGSVVSSVVFRVCDCGRDVDTEAASSGEGTPLPSSPSAMTVAKPRKLEKNSLTLVVGIWHCDRSPHRKSTFTRGHTLQLRVSLCHDFPPR